MSLFNPRPVEVIVMTGGGEAETAERCDGLGTFFVRKGPDFWDNLKAALVEIYPDLVHKIEEFPAAAGAGVHAGAARRRRKLLKRGKEPQLLAGAPRAEAAG